MDDIAKASGAAKTTIYRRWPSLAALAVDSLAASIGDRSFTPTDDPIADLKRACTMLMASVNAGSTSWLGVALDLQQQPDGELHNQYRQRIIEPPRALLMHTLARVHSTGRLSSVATIEVWTDFLIGAAIYRIVVLHDPVTPDDISAIIDGIATRESIPLAPRERHQGIET